MKKRIIYSSPEVGVQAIASADKKVRVYGIFPVDRENCVCQKVAEEWKRKLGTASPQEREKITTQTPFLTCPRDKTGMTRYEVVCRVCSEVQGYCYAMDATLIDWCDFHYVQWSDGERWHGCFTPHISPVTQTLAFECCCGNDTRDFRANMVLPQKIADKIEAKNKNGRAFNRSDSKFIVRKARKVLI